MSTCTAPGCTWNGTACVGAPGTCQSRPSQLECKRPADGCSWSEERCSGESAPCANYGDESSCSAIIGCNWE